MTHPEPANTETIMEEPTLRQAASRRTSVWFAVMLACALTLPFWQGPLLDQLRLRTPDNRRLAELALASDRLVRQVDDLQARLREAVEAVGAAREEAAAASRMANAAQARLSTLALIQLSAAMRHSGRFETELAMAWAAGGPVDGLAPLLEQVRPYAAFGIPALPQLRRDFSILAGRLGRSSEGSGHLGWVTSLIWLPRSNPVSGDAAMILVGQVRDLLAGEDLSGALVLARQVPDPARGMLADWLDDAAAREAAETLARHVATLAGQAIGPPP